MADEIIEMGGRCLDSAYALLPPDFDPDSRPRNIQSITWGIGNLRVFAVSTTDLDVHNGLSYRFPNVLPLWPLNGDMVWPPSITADDAYMFDLARMLGRETERLAAKPL